MSEDMSSSIRQELVDLRTLQSEAAKRVLPLVELFHEELTSVSGASFEANEEGYRQSFQLIDELQRTAHALQRMLTIGDLPTILTRELPPNSENGKVIFTLRNWETGEQRAELLAAIPLLSTKTSSETQGMGMLEMERQRGIENLRIQLHDLAGKPISELVGSQVGETMPAKFKSKSESERKEIERRGLEKVENLNSEKAELRVKFLYAGKKTNGEFVNTTLKFRSGSFILKQTDRLQPQVFSGTEFPVIYLQ